MNILYLLPFWPHLYTPFLFREMAWMRSRGHRVAVVSLRPWPDGQVNVVNNKLEDVPVLQVRREYPGDGAVARQTLRAMLSGGSGGRGVGLRDCVGSKGFRHGLHEWSMLRQVIAFARQHKSEVIDAHWATEAGHLAHTLAGATGLRYAVTMHGGDLYRAPSPDLPAIVAGAAAVCPVSAFLVRLLRGERPVESLPVVPRCEVPPQRLRVRHHGLSRETVASEPVTQTDDQFVICTTGRLDPEKRHRDIVEALGQISSDCPQARLRIIGGGRLDVDLKQQAMALGSGDKLEITGPRPWPEVMQLVRQSHVYVQASDVEGFGLATLEGACQGMPVIASRTGAHTEIVDDGKNGWLYDAGDVDALAGRLRAVIEAGAAGRQAMGEASLRLVRERFLFEELMPRVEAMLDAIRRDAPLPE